MLEKQIEKAVCEYAKSLGILTYKFTSPGRAAVPDRLFIAPGGKVMFIEFKRAGQMVTPAQFREHERLRAQGCTVWAIDNTAGGKLMVDRLLVQ